MYSFGRIFTYNAFIGGFVREYLTSGIYKRFKNTTAAVYELEVTDTQYKGIKEKVTLMYKRRRQYRFNFIGVFFVMFHKRIKRKNALYCAEFVKYAIASGDVDMKYLPEIIKPEDFKQVKNIKLIYTGKLNQYRNRIRAIEASKTNDIPVTIIRTKAAV